MRKNIIKLSFLFIMFGFLMTSCNKDDNTQTEPDAVTATVEYTIPNRYDLSKYFDITVYYTDSVGKEASEVVTSDMWKKSLTKVPVPGTYQLRVVYVRNNMPLKQNNYRFGTGLSLSYLTSTGSLKSFNNSVSVTVSNSQVEEYLKNITEEKASIEITE